LSLRPLFAAAVALSLGCAPKHAEFGQDAECLDFVYPAARRADDVESHFGVDVPDPYRWLEDPDSAETRSWIDAQNALTDSVLADIPERDAIRERLTELWDYERYSTPWQMGGRTFFSKNDGLQEHSVVYVADGPDSPPRVLLDPNGFSEDGTVSLGATSFSWDGRYIAYALSDGGSDWRTWRVRDIETGQDLDDRIEWAKFSGVAWAPDNTGFWYSRFPAPDSPLEQVNENQKLYYHVLGTPQSQDELIYADPEHPTRGVGADVSEDGRMLWLWIGEGTEEKNRLYYWRLDDKGRTTGPLVKLFDDYDAMYGVLGQDGDRVYISTNLDAPRGRVFALDLSAPDKASWVDVLPQGADTLESVSIVGDSLFAVTLHDAHSVVRRYGLDGSLQQELPLPGVGSAGGFGGLRSATDTYFYYTDFITPPSLYRYDLQSSAISVWKAPKVDFDRDRYITEQVFYTSKDGTKIPMFITRRRDLKPDGSNPTLLYGYGGFNIPLTPGFRADRAVWLEMGGIYAVANLRGGGEYGEDWHMAGTRLSKQNVFDDFIAGAEWLIGQGWTRPERLAINGRSNGGLLVGAVMVQRPDLFGAALPGVGVLDMLRYHQFTIGWAWASDYGRADDSEEMFQALLAYSPVHNVWPGTRYPATLIHTADHDDRVVPGHSFKFAAALQEGHRGDPPVLIRIETRAGHGAGMSTSQRIDEAADLWAFLVRALGFRPDGLTVRPPADALPPPVSAPAAPAGASAPQ
jgi:prolyl oligopeptidase